MKEQLEKGDIVQINGGVVWFVEEVGGQELVQGRCVRPGPVTVHPFGATATLSRPVVQRTEFFGTARDFDHACAIVALMMG